MRPSPPDHRVDPPAPRAAPGTLGTTDQPTADQRLAAVALAARARYYAGPRATDPDLRAAVHAVVDARHAEGLDVLAVLRAVKADVAARGAPPSRVLDDAVRWCIARYYDGPGS